MDFTSLELLPVMFIGFMFKLLMAAVGYHAMRAILRQLDERLKFDFKEWLHNADDLSKGIYLGLRVLSIAIFMAWIIS